MWMTEWSGPRIFGFRLTVRLLTMEKQLLVGESKIISKWSTEPSILRDHFQ